MTSDPRKLSEGDRLRAYHDAINAYIAMYGAGGDGDGREEFSKSQEAMFIPAEFRGRVYALKVNPIIFRRILLREYREEVVENEEEMKREIREREKELEEAQKKLDEAKEKAKKKAKQNEEVHQDRKNQMMIAQQHRDNSLLALGMAGGAISMVQVERMELNQMKTRSVAKKLQHYWRQTKEYLQQVKQQIKEFVTKGKRKPVKRLTFVENKRILERKLERKLEEEPDMIREKRGLGKGYKTMAALQREFRSKLRSELLKDNPAAVKKERDGSRGRSYSAS